MSVHAARIAGRRARVTPRALVLLVAVLAMLLAISYPLRQYVDARGDVARLEQRLSGLEEQNRTLHEQIERLHDPEYVERLARECLGMVRPGEIAFVVAPEGGEAEPPAC